MTVTALFPVSPPTVDGSHDFLLFLMLCLNFLGGLFRKTSAMASALRFCWDFRQAFVFTFVELFSFMWVGTIVYGKWCFVSHV